MKTAIDTKNRILSLHEVLAWLEQDELVSKDNAHMLRTLAIGKQYTERHPLLVISGTQLD